MSDYIKREDAENAIIGRCEESALWKLRHLPTADVVEVVQCKDCKWAGRDEHCPGIEVYMICGDNGYCSCGERKEQENEQ